VRLILSRLFVESLQYFIGVGVHIKIHFFVVVFQQVLGVGRQRLIDKIVGLEVSGLPGDYVDDEVFEDALGSAIL
jgi:hypothetical protein